MSPWFDVANAKEQISSTELDKLIKFTKKITKGLENLRNQNFISTLENICKINIEEINRHSIEEVKLLSKFIAQNTSESTKGLKGVYKCVKRLFQVFADACEFPNYTIEETQGFFSNSQKMIARPYSSSKMLDLNFEFPPDFSQEFLKMMRINKEVQADIDQKRHNSLIPNLKLLRYLARSEPINRLLLIPDQETDQILTGKAFKACCSLVTKLELVEVSRLCGKDIELIADYFPNLTSLSLGYITSIAEKRLAKLTSLEHLSLGGCTNSNMLKFREFNFKFLKQLENLNSLTVYQDTGFELEDLKNSPSITHLNVSFLPIRTLDSLVYIPQLKFLDVSHCAKLKDISGLKNCMNLEEINFRFCRRLNMDFLLDFPKLRIVRYSLPDAIPKKLKKQLENKGVQVFLENWGNASEYRQRSWDEECEYDCTLINLGQP